MCRPENLKVLACCHPARPLCGLASGKKCPEYLHKPPFFDLQKPLKTAHPRSSAVTGARFNRPKTKPSESVRRFCIVPSKHTPHKMLEGATAMSCSSVKMIIPARHHIIGGNSSSSHALHWLYHMSIYPKFCWMHSHKGFKTITLSPSSRLDATVCRWRM